ncbi:phage neck terminator protein [Candidatus Arsenophonus triatominarum]|uniref:phage neck terminator protein n=1 Tax=Candidatus Arsenophonus triatominarum TaxID=57911 RepID=UPI0007C5A4D0|nr:hypothetical protein [Candidatus Arsenophonus triatominarum]
MNDYTVNQVIDTLADFIEPIAGTVWQAQDNRNPMPSDIFCVLTPLRFIRLSAARGIAHDSGNPQTSTMNWTEVRQADIQLDIYGENAGDRSIRVETLFASDYGYSESRRWMNVLLHFMPVLLATSMLNSDTMGASVHPAP